MKIFLRKCFQSIENISTLFNLPPLFPLENCMINLKLGVKILEIASVSDFTNFKRIGRYFLCAAFTLSKI